MAKAPTPPHSSDAEQSVLGSLLIDHESFMKVTPILTSPLDFYDPVHQEIYAAILSLHESGRSLDLLTVTEAVRNATGVNAAGGSAYLADLTTTVPTTANVESYAAIVRAHAKRRQFLVFARKTAQLAYDETQPIDEVHQQIESEFIKTSTAATNQPLANIVDATHERFHNVYLPRHEAKDKTAHYGVLSHIPSLDRLFNGFQPATLTVLAARPAMGKTALCLNIADNAARSGAKVLFFSIEMSKEQLTDRLASRHTSSPVATITSGKLTHQEFNNLADYTASLGDTVTPSLFISDDGDANILAIRSIARRHALEHGLDLLMIDYLQLINTPADFKGEGRVQEVTYITRQLKALARELNVPLIAISQLSRLLEKRSDKRPLMSDLRDSGSIEQDADNILMLHREHEYDREVPASEAELLVRKHRQGETTDIYLYFDRESMCFTEATSAREVPANALPVFG